MKPLIVERFTNNQCCGTCPRFYFKIWSLSPFALSPNSFQSTEEKVEIIKLGFAPRKSEIVCKEQAVTYCPQLMSLSLKLFWVPGVPLKLSKERVLIQTLRLFLIQNQKNHILGVWTRLSCPVADDMGKVVLSHTVSSGTEHVGHILRAQD